jgi:hypothetical protein
VFKESEFVKKSKPQSSKYKTHNVSITLISDVLQSFQFDNKEGLFPKLPCVCVSVFEPFI